MRSDGDQPASALGRALALWASLDNKPSAPRPAGLLAAVLAVVPVAAGAAMPLVWHHLTVPNPGYSGPPVVEMIHGTDTATWLIAVAALAVVLAVRALHDAPGPVGTWVVTALALATADGMFIDWFDWSTRGVSLSVQAYHGPGFFVGLACAAVVVAAAVVAWRTRRLS